MNNFQFCIPKRESSFARSSSGALLMKMEHKKYNEEQKPNVLTFDIREAILWIRFWFYFPGRWGRCYQVLVYHSCCRKESVPLRWFNNILINFLKIHFNTILSILSIYFPTVFLTSFRDSRVGFKVIWRLKHRLLGPTPEYLVEEVQMGWWICFFFLEICLFWERVRERISSSLPAERRGQ